MKTGRTRSITSAAMLALALLAACASPGFRSGARECRVELLPAPASIGEIADSSGLQAAVERHWQAGTELAVATLRWDSAGVLAEPGVLSTHLSPAAVESMKRALTPSVRDRADAGSVAYLVLGEGGVPGVRRVARLGMCAPLFLNRDEMTRAVQASLRGMNVPRVERIRLLVKVLTDGSAGEIRIDEGTGDASMDMAAARVFRGARFDPARIHGIPVEVWAAFPVTLRASGPGAS